MKSYRVIRDEFEGGCLRSQDPLVCVIDDFIEPDLCEHLIEIARPKMARATVASKGQRAISDVRTNKMAFLPHSMDSKIQGLVSKSRHFNKI